MDIDVEVLQVVLRDSVVANLNNGKIIASKAGATVPGVNSANYHQYLFELCAAVVEGKLHVDKFFVGIDATGIEEEIADILANAFWLLSVRYEKNSEFRDRLAQLAKECLDKQKVSKRVLQETQEHEFLEDAGVIPSGDTFRKKEIRYNTKTVYLQHKYNLLREENEGYAKLISCLYQVGCADLSDQAISAVTEEIKALVGYFDLDPNRVFALLLDAYEQHPNSPNFLKLVPLFNTDAPSQILGFKFQYHKKEGNPPAPASLYVVAASLIGAGYAKLEELLAHLGPDDEVTRSNFQAAAAAVQQEVDKIGEQKLAATPDAQDTTRGRLNSSLLDIDARRYDALLVERMDKDNQKLGLIQGFLSVGDWAHASQLMHVMESQGLQTSLFPAVSSALCQNIDSRISPQYLAMFPKGRLHGYVATPPKEGGEAMDPLVVEMLQSLGLYLYRDLPLLYKVIRVLRHHVAELISSAAGSPPDFGQIEMILVKAVLPALALWPANPGLVEEVWQLLSSFPYGARYRIYSYYWEEMESNPLLQAASKLAVLEAKKVLRRVHNVKDKNDRKATTKPFGRIIAKVTHATPLAVMDTILWTIEQNDNLIEATIDSLKFMSPWAFDILTYAIITRLGASDRKKLKSDGVTIEKWLQALAQFAGHVCKKCGGMELRALCAYVVHQLKSGDSFDLLVLKELISQLTGINVVHDVSESDMDTLAGSDTLQSRGFNTGVDRSNKAFVRGTRKLIDALMSGSDGPPLALPLLILIAQQEDIVAINTESRHLKLIAELNDKCHETLFEYIEFLKGALSLEEYIQTLPPVNVLIREYGLRPEVAFALYRPIMRSLEHQMPSLAEDGEIQGEEGEEEGQMATDSMIVEQVAPGQLTWDQMMANIKRVAPESTWDCLPPQLYATFWSLSLYDIYFPEKKYEYEISRAKAEIRSMDDRIQQLRQEEQQAIRLKEQGDMRAGYGGMSAGGGMYPGVSGMNNPTAGPPDPLQIEEEKERAKKDKLQLQETLERLQDDCERHRKRYAEVTARLEREKDTFMVHHISNLKNFPSAFLQHCILPRVLYSAEDAVYCARFAMRLHVMSTPYFSTVIYVDKVMLQTMGMLSSCTDREAQNLGLFMLEMWKILREWRQEEVYAKECLSKTGFTNSLQDLRSPRTDYNTYKRLFLKWEKASLKAFRECLSSGEYVQIRNALWVLNKLSGYYPLLDTWVTISLKPAVEAVRDQDLRNDLKMMAKRFVMVLDKEKEVPGRFLTPEEYGEELTIAKRRVPTRPAAEAPPAKRVEVDGYQEAPGVSGKKATGNTSAAASNTAHERSRPADNPADGEKNPKKPRVENEAGEVPVEKPQNGVHKRKRDKEGEAGDKDKADGELKREAEVKREMEVKREAEIKREVEVKKADAQRERGEKDRDGPSAREDKMERNEAKEAGEKSPYRSRNAVDRQDHAGEDGPDDRRVRGRDADRGDRVTERAERDRDKDRDKETVREKDRDRDKERDREKDREADKGRSREVEERPKDKEAKVDKKDREAGGERGEDVDGRPSTRSRAEPSPARSGHNTPDRPRRDSSRDGRAPISQASSAPRVRSDREVVFDPPPLQQRTRPRYQDQNPGNGGPTGGGPGAPMVYDGQPPPPPRRNDRLPEPPGQSQNMNVPQRRQPRHRQVPYPDADRRPRR